jgi:hypothetical protein
MQERYEPEKFSEGMNKIEIYKGRVSRGRNEPELLGIMKWR